MSKQDPKLHTDPMWYKIVAVSALFFALGALAINIIYDDDKVGTHTHPTDDLDRLRTLLGDITTIHLERDNDLLRQINALEIETVDMKAEYTAEIVKNRKLIQERVPLGSIDTDKDTAQEAAGDTIGLTIELDAEEYFRGETVEVTGVANPKQQVQAYVVRADGIERFPNASADQNGQYVLYVFTTFDSPLGEYTVFVESQGKKSELLTFMIKE